MNLRKYKNVTERRKALEEEFDMKLSHIGKFSMDESRASSRNCENMIGATQIPLGIAGPLHIKRLAFSELAFSEKNNNNIIPTPLSVIPDLIGNLKSNKKDLRIREDDNKAYKEVKDYYLPLATTEGALVASVNRGCKAINLSGGVNVMVQRIGATRGPVFKVKNLSEGIKLENYLKTNWQKIKQIAENTSHHLTLSKYDFRSTGKYRFVRFYFDTSDAMGLNMVTIATDAIVKQIENEINVKCLDVSGNYCIDKKPAWLNFINQRGFAINAEIELTHKAIKETLKTTAKKIYDSWLVKCMIGSAMSGSMGFNGHFANIIAAIFAATGQDLGHVVEGSMGITTTEIVRPEIRDQRPDNSCQNVIPAKAGILRNKIPDQVRDDEDGLYISVYLPSLMIGTVGGGTNLETQLEALQILGISGGNNGKNAQKFAEIIAGAVLAGEISLLASLSEGSLAQSHKFFARSKK